jgi:hypothetical protein
MPFIKPERREMVDKRLKKFGTEDREWEPGDKCYYYYKKMVDQWKANPRWTTAHEIYKEMLRFVKPYTHNDWDVAYHLAWQVFFQLYVIPYEEEKREQNGDI